MMVNFNNLMTTASTNTKGASVASETHAPETGFGALFAALQTSNAQLDQVSSKAQLQQLASTLKDNERQQLLEQTALEQDLSPEALAQILAQLQQRQPQVPSTEAATVTESANAATFSAVLSAQPVAQAELFANPQAPAVADESAPQLNQAMPTAQSVKTNNLVEPNLSNQVGISEAKKLNGQSPKPEVTPSLTAELKQVDTKTTMDTSRITPPTTLANPTAAPVATSSLSASIVMIDAPIAPSAQAPVATPSTTATTATIAAPVGSHAWANQLQQNVMQMVMHNQNEMTLRLHPAELGPLQVQLRMDDSTAQLNILTHSQHVRGALEQAMPNLRDALANQGIQLGDSQVSDQSQQFMQQQARQQAQQWTGDAQQNERNTNKSTVENSESAENTDMGVNSRHTAAAHNGQVDTFA